MAIIDDSKTESNPYLFTALVLAPIFLAVILVLYACTGWKQALVSVSIALGLLYAFAILLA